MRDRLCHTVRCEAADREVAISWSCRSVGQVTRERAYLWHAMGGGGGEG